MKYIQGNFLKGEANRQIGDDSVNLVISSVPLDILDDIDRLSLLFEILNRVVAPDGRILIDYPASDFGKKRSNLFHVGLAYGRPVTNIHFIQQMFPGIDQDISVHTRIGHRGISGNEFKTSRTRQMGHRCEFCHTLINSLIMEYRGAYIEPVVLDPFCGTGTVPGEAELLGFEGIGCDIRPVENIREEYRL